MIMADVFTWFFLILGLMLVYNCYWLATRALFPGLVAQCEEFYATPLRITGLGLAAGAPVIAIAIGLAATKNPATQLMGGMLLTLPVLAGLAGSAGLAQRIGSGLNSTVDEAQPWRKVLRGGPVLTFMCLLPFLGWFVLQPWMLISGIGAIVKSVTTNRRAAQTSRRAAPVATPSLSESNPAVS